MFLAHNLSNIWNILLCRHEISEVVELQYIITTRDDSVGIALYRNHMVRVVWSAYLFQRFVQYLASLTKLNAQHYQCSIVHIPPLAHPRHLKSVDDVSCCQHLWVNQFINTELAEEFLLFVSNEFCIINLRHCLLSTQSMGYDTGIEV